MPLEEAMLLQENNWREYIANKRIEAEARDAIHRKILVDRRSIAETQLHESTIAKKEMEVKLEKHRMQFLVASREFRSRKETRKLLDLWVCKDTPFVPAKIQILGFQNLQQNHYRSFNSTILVAKVSCVDGSPHPGWNISPTTDSQTDEENNIQERMEENGIQKNMICWAPTILVELLSDKRIYKYYAQDMNNTNGFYICHETYAPLSFILDGFGTPFGPQGYRKVLLSKFETPKQIEQTISDLYQNKEKIEEEEQKRAVELEAIENSLHQHDTITGRNMKKIDTSRCKQKDLLKLESLPSDTDYRVEEYGTYLYRSSLRYILQIEGRLYISNVFVEKHFSMTLLLDNPFILHTLSIGTTEAKNKAMRVAIEKAPLLPLPTTTTVPQPLPMEHSIGTDIEFWEME